MTPVYICKFVECVEFDRTFNMHYREVHEHWKNVAHIKYHGKDTNVWREWKTSAECHKSYAHKDMSQQFLYKVIINLRCFSTFLCISVVTSLQFFDIAILKWQQLQQLKLCNEKNIKKRWFLPLIAGQFNKLKYTLWTFAECAL